MLYNADHPLFLEGKRTSNLAYPISPLIKCQRSAVCPLILADNRTNNSARPIIPLIKRVRNAASPLILQI